MPKSMFPERSTERSNNGKVFKGPGGEHIKNYGQQVTSVRTLEGFVRESTWQVADVEDPLCRHLTSSKPEAACSSATAPIKYKPMEVDTINQVADGREQRKLVTFDCRKPF